MEDASPHVLTIIVPCYNEEESIPLFMSKMNTIMSVMPEIVFELIFIDDGSIDSTLSILRGLSDKDRRVRYISFSRNFGKEAAMFAGLEAAVGDYIAIMDIDLQDPPDLLPKMYEAIVHEGYDCAAARRVTRRGESTVRSFFAKMFYKIINKLSKTEIVDGARDFRLMTRQVADAILSLKEYNRFSKGIFGLVGFRTKWLEYDNIPRAAGRSKWSFWRLFAYAIDGVIGFSTMPLAISSVFGVLLCLLSLVAVVFIVLRRLLFGDPVGGWASIVCILFFLSGIQLFCTGVLGQYLAKTYLESKHRPVYVVKEKVMKKNYESPFISGKWSAERICLVIAVCSFLFMIVFAGNAALSIDDLFTLGVVKKNQSLKVAVDMVLKDSHSQPPLFYVIAAIWIRIVPYGTFWLRVPNMIFVAAGVYLCGNIAKRLKGARAGIFASLFACASAFLVRQGGHTFRQYGALFFLAAFLAFAYLRRMEYASRERKKDIVWCGIAMTALVYMHYMGLILVGAFFLGDIYFFLRKKIKWQCVLSYVMAGLMFLPWGLYAATVILDRDATFWAAPPTLLTLRNLVFTLLGDSTLLVVCFIVISVLMFAKKRPPVLQQQIETQNWDSLSLLNFSCLFVLICVFVYSGYLYPSGSFFVERYFISILPVMFILCGVGIDLALDLSLQQRTKDAVKTISVIVFMTLVIIFADHAFVKVYKETEPGRKTLELAIEWIYEQEGQVPAPSSAIMAYKWIEHYVDYYAQDGRKPPLNFIEIWGDTFTEAEVEIFDTIYSYGSPEPDYKRRQLLTEYYDLVEENKPLGIRVYERKSSGDTP